MLRTPTELERLHVFNVAELARRQLARGIALSQPEAIAYICDEICLRAREGRSVAELMGFGSTLLNSDDVLPGVAEMTSQIAMEAMFPDGVKMVTVHQPIRPGRRAPAGHPVPGELLPAKGDIEINAGRESLTLTVRNTGDRPVQVGSHYHFFETNPALDFEREKTLGMHLDVPAGASVRFAPGERREVTLVAYGGRRAVNGFHGLVDGPLEDEAVRTRALESARARGFRGV